MTVKQARKLINILVVVGLLVSLLAYFHETFFYIGLAIMFSSLIPHLLFNRCPNCRKLLGWKQGDYCPFCGEKLELNKKQGK